MFLGHCIVTLKPIEMTDSNVTFDMRKFWNVFHPTRSNLTARRGRKHLKMFTDEGAERVHTFRGEFKVYTLSLVTFVTKRLQTSRWFRRPRAVGFDRAEFWWDRVYNLTRSVRPNDTRGTCNQASVVASDRKAFAALSISMPRPFGRTCGTVVRARWRGRGWDERGRRRFRSADSPRRTPNNLKTFLITLHENFEKFEMISTPTGSWIRSRRRRDRIQLARRGRN